MTALESPFVAFNGTTDPHPCSIDRIATRRIVVRLDPHVEVDGVRVGVVQFGQDVEWVPGSFDELVLPPYSRSAPIVHAEDVPGLVRYCAECDVEAIIDREFWSYSRLYI